MGHLARTQTLPFTLSNKKNSSLVCLIFGACKCSEVNDEYVQNIQTHSVECHCNCSYVLSVPDGVSNKLLLLFRLKILPRARNGRGDIEIFLSFFLFIISLYSS